MAVEPVVPSAHLNAVSHFKDYENWHQSMARWRWPRGIVRCPSWDSGKSLYTWRPLKPTNAVKNVGCEKFNLTMEVILEASPDRFGKVAARGLRVSKERNPVDHLVRIQTNGIDFFEYASKICCPTSAFAQTQRNQQQRPPAGRYVEQNDPSSERIDASALPLRTHLLPGFGTIPQLEARRFHREHAIWFLKRRTGLFYN
jgi:hypothetical protein